MRGMSVHPSVMQDRVEKGVPRGGEFTGKRLDYADPGVQLVEPDLDTGPGDEVRSMFSRQMDVARQLARQQAEKANEYLRYAVARDIFEVAPDAGRMSIAFYDDGTYGIEDAFLADGRRMGLATREKVYEVVGKHIDDIADYLDVVGEETYTLHVADDSSYQPPLPKEKEGVQVPVGFIANLGTDDFAPVPYWPPQLPEPNVEWKTGQDTIDIVITSGRFRLTRSMTRSGRILQQEVAGQSALGSHLPAVADYADEVSGRIRTLAHKVEAEAVSRHDITQQITAAATGRYDLPRWRGDHWG